MKTTLLLSTMAIALYSFAGASAAHAREDGDNFAGVKIGVQAGWERRKFDETVLPAPDTVRLNDKASGLAYGGFVGFDAQFDKLVLGLEADFSPNGKSLRAARPEGSIELDSKWSAGVSARAGIAITPNVLAYGRLGYGLNRYTVRGLVTGNTTPVVTEKATGGRLIYGGGVEVAINRHASFRVEYRRNDHKRSFDSNQVLGGLTLRF